MHVHVCILVHHLLACLVPKEGRECGSLWNWSDVVLGTESRSSGSNWSALNHGTASPAPSPPFLMSMSLSVISTVWALTMAVWGIRDSGAEKSTLTVICGLYGKEWGRCCHGSPLRTYSVELEACAGVGAFCKPLMGKCS